MVEVSVDDGKLVLSKASPGNYFVRPLVFPLENIIGARIDNSLARNWLRKREFLADYVPNAIREGAYYTDKNCAFWEVNNANQTIVIHTQNELYEKLVVEVRNPAEAVGFIENAIRNGQSADLSKSSEEVLDDSSN